MGKVKSEIPDTVDIAVNTDVKPVKRKAGRPEKKLPIAQKESFIQAIRVGNTIDSACAFAGLSYGVVKHWLKMGAYEIQRAEMDAIKKGSPTLLFKKTQEPYALFAQEVAKAMSEGETRDLTIIARAGEQQWQAAAWRRERMQPHKYARRTVVSGNDGGNVQIDLNVRRNAMNIIENKEKAELANIVKET